MFGFKRKKKLEDLSMREGVSLITLNKPKSIAAEQFRIIRTNIQFSSVDNPCQTMLVTSPGPSAGKSTVSSNLAVAFADQNQRVLLIDGDLRRSTAFQTFNLDNRKGLTTLLTEKEFNFNEAIRKIKQVDNLYVLPSGPVPPNPSELLNSKKMDHLLELLKKSFDVIIFDMPPVISVTDAQIMATKVDGVIVVVRQDVSIKSAVTKTKELLENVHANVLGYIFNGVKSHGSDGYYGYYGYYGADVKDESK